MMIARRSPMFCLGCSESSPISIDLSIVEIVSQFVVFGQGSHKDKKGPEDSSLGPERFGWLGEKPLGEACPSPLDGQADGSQA